MAVVRAQAKSAQTSVNYIKTVGFDSNNFTRNVDFAYTTQNATTGKTQQNVLSVPFLTLVPIPFIRVSGWLITDISCLPPHNIHTHM